jgi:rfaE bifunctional protein nucleotidyltransferase chain/domain
MSEPKKSTLEHLQAKILDWEAARDQVRKWQDQGLEVVFTNGCFDLLHYGHLQYLAEASDLGDRLVIGLNSRESVSRLKGAHRPIHDDQTRLFQLAALSFVDAIVIFEQDTPAKLIASLVPDLLVKGGDYQVKEIVGSETVLDHGGQVRSLEFVPGYSTTRIEEKIKKGEA